MPFFNNKRKDFSIQPPVQSIANGAFTVSDSANIDFTYALNNLTANLTVTGVPAGTYGSSTLIPVITLDVYGRITGVTTTTFSTSGISLETNGTPNPIQTILNLVEGTNMTITDDGLGNITFDAASGGSNLNDTTGILFGGVLSATIGGTTFSVTAGIGQIVTQTATIAGVATTVSNVTWSAVTGTAITNIGTSQFTYVLVNSSGTVIQQTTPFTDAQYKTHIIIGILCHINLASVNLVTNSQNVAYEDPHRLVELISAFGPIKKSGLNIGPNGANLRVNRTSGEAFKIGANYITDQFEPDVSIISAKTPAKLCRAYGNNSVGFTFDTDGGLFYDDIDRNQYFNPTTGVLETVGGSKWTIQRLFFFPNNPDDIICYYGVQTYNQFSEARANLEFETFDEAQITAENAVFLGFLFVRHNATDLSDPNEAAFLQSGLFRGIPPGGGGGGGTSLSLETNGTPNGSQALLNLVEGANTVITDDGVGNVTIDSDTSRVLILSQDASSSATIEFVNLFTADYSRYEIEIDNALPAVAGAIKMEIGTGSSPTWQTGSVAYGWLSTRLLNLGTGTSALTFTQTDGQDSAITLLLLFSNIASQNSFSGTVVIYNPLQSFAYHQFTFILSETQSPAQQLYRGQATYWDTIPVTSIRFYSATGNLLRGNFRLYGYK